LATCWNRKRAKKLRHLDELRTLLAKLEKKKAELQEKDSAGAKQAQTRATE